MTKHIVTQHVSDIMPIIASYNDLKNEESLLLGTITTPKWRVVYFSCNILLKMLKALASKKKPRLYANPSQH